MQSFISSLTQEIPATALCNICDFIPNLGVKKNHQQTDKQQPTHNEAIVSSVLTVEEAVAGLEEEQTCLGVIVIRGYTEGPETFTLSQQLLFSRIGPLVRCSLSEGKHAALT